MTDVLRIICPNLSCRSILSVPSTARGKYVRCRMCGTKVAIPSQPLRPVPAVPVEDTDEPTTEA